MKTMMQKIAMVIAMVLGLNTILMAEDHLFTLPVVGDDVIITAAWFYPNGGNHQAIDYAAANITGRDVLASYGGVVMEVENNVQDNDHSSNHPYGNYIKIDHQNGYFTLYAHCLYNSISLNVGDYVFQGQLIARVGNTGVSTGPHLHFQVWYHNNPIDPYGWYAYANTPNTYPACNSEEYYWLSSPPTGPTNVDEDRQLPDDLLVHVLGSPNYYWLRDGIMHAFSSEYSFYTWGFSWDEAVEITNDELNNFSIGSNVPVMLGAGVFDQNYQRWVFDYASDNSLTIVKRKVNNLDALHYAYDIWIPVSNDFMSQFNEGSELLSTSDYPYGAVLQNETNLSERYVLVKGDDYGMPGQKVKLSLFSDDVYNFNYYHYNFNIPVSSSVLSNYSTVSGYLLLRDGKLIKGSGPEIYYLENGQKRHLVDEMTFAYYGFSYAYVHTVNDNLLNAYPLGNDIFFNPSGGAGAYNGGELEDGGFDSGLECYWLFSDWQELASFQVSTGDPVAGAYKSEFVVSSSSNYYDVELKQLVDVENSALYNFSFYLKSNNPMNIKVNLGKDTSPWNNYGLWKEITTTNNWKKYQYIFTCNETDALARLAFQIGEDPGHLYLDQVVFEKIEDISSPENNLLANADFELGHYAPWQMEDHNNTAEYYTDSSETHTGEYSMFIDSNQTGEPYQVQLRQSVNVQSGETYDISFYAKAQTNRNMILELCREGSPWNNYGLWSLIDISSEWHLYNVQFVANNSGLARFAMYFGEEDGGIWIDDVVLSAHNSSDADDLFIESNDLILNQNYPNPFNPETEISYFLSGNLGSKLLIYNLKGQLVKTYNLDPQKNFVVWNALNNQGQKVSSGIYFYFIQTKNESTRPRKMLLLK